MSADKVTPVLMPKAGNSMEEGTIVQWIARPGDQIEVGQILFEVETDKATVEVEATDTGRLAKIVVNEGETIGVQKPVAYLADNDADVDAYLAGQGGQQTEPQKTAAPAQPQSTADSEPAREAQVTAPPTAVPSAPSATDETGRAQASPAARKAARQTGVDLATLPAGSGPGGRILSTDIPAAGQAASASTPAAGATGGRQPLSKMRRAIGKALQVSKQTIPHFYIEATAEADALMDYCRLAKAKHPCSVNDVIVLALGRAVAEFPAFRTRIDGDDAVTEPQSNIGVAVGMDEGLVVPVVVGVEAMSLKQLAAETRRVIDAARNGKIENQGKGVMTVSNLGMFGVERFSAIINPPESAILAVGAVREEVIVSGGTMRPGRRMTATLSCDHRVVDGVTAAKFLVRLKQLLENPGLLG